MAHVSMPTNPRFVNQTGKDFGRLTVIEYAGYTNANGRTISAWKCRCTCGTELVVRLDSFRINSRCTCAEIAARKKRVVPSCVKSVRTPEYVAYKGARKRCQNPNCKSFADYGGRGIQFRFATFDDFLAEVGPRPSPLHSVDRIRTEGHYETGNVKWSTRAEQNSNKRNNWKIEFRGRTFHLSELAAEVGMKKLTLRGRFDRGWCVECAATLPIKWGHPASCRCPHTTERDGRTGRAFPQRQG